jgi:hypothetical protein
MNSKPAVFALVIASLLLADKAQAQIYPINDLRGINRIRLLVEKLNESHDECRITEALIRDAFMYPASGARFVVVNDILGVPFMYFNIATMWIKSDQRCFSHVDMRLQVNQNVKLEASGRTIFSTIELWTLQSIWTSGKDRHAQAIRDSIEQMTKKFITDWNLDNK